jgi:hypothetical protein
MTPLSPKLLRGAIISFKLPNPLPYVIAFQYNPATLQRTLEARTAGGGDSAGEEAFRISGAPNETLKVEIELDGTDSTASDRSGGVLAQLAALEMLIAPSTELVIANTVLAQIGTIELLPPQAPFTLFVFGRHRILPVRISEFSVSEDEFEPELAPIRAKVSLGLKVLTYSDLPLTHPGHHLYLAHQIAKEALARQGTVNSLDAVLGAGQRIL